MKVRFCIGSILTLVYKCDSSEVQDNSLGGCNGLDFKEKTSESQRIAYNTVYRNSLESILRSALDDFNKMTYDLKNFQHATLRNYLWISTVVFASEVSFFSGLSDGSSSMLSFLSLSVNIQSCMFKLLACVSLLMSLGVFLLGVDTMRGRGLTLKPAANTWMVYTKIAYADCDQEYKDDYRMLVIEHLDKALVIHQEQSNKIGTKLRWLSYGIIYSVVLAALTVFC